MMRLFLSLAFLFVSFTSNAQDKILLINGKVIEVKSVDVIGNTIAYHTLKRDKPRKINPERVFSIQHTDGTERIVYVSDPLDPSDFKPEEMRMFIKGEQEANMYHRTIPHEIAAAAIGAGAGLLTIYGLIIPALYSTVAGSFSPNIERCKVSDPALKNDLSFREGYEKRCRDKKIRNSLIFGFGGFAVGFTAFAIFLPK